MTTNNTPDKKPAQPVKVETPPDKGDEFGGFADRSDDAKKTSGPNDS